MPSTCSNGCLLIAVLSVFQSSAFHTPTKISSRWGSYLGTTRTDSVDVLSSPYDSTGLAPGAIDGFFVVKQYTYEPSSFSHHLLDESLVHRLDLSAANLTVPVALMLLDSVQYPSLSRARKACRKKSIVLYQNNDDVPTLARVSDRVVPGDILGVQERMSHGAYSQVLSLAKPSFDLPVVYQDDHMAIVQKPAGITVYEDGGGGRGNIRFALPYVLEPPLPSEEQALARPELCHRLDKPTSGLLVVAKTKPAVLHLSQQFEHRQLQKTYAAIVYGIPQEATTLSSQEAFQMGFDVNTKDTNWQWHLAETVLENKTAVTLWRIVETYDSPSGPLSLVELKPKTGRYHQLRRQMAWRYECPIVGDTTYGPTVPQRWKRGLMLCANRIVLKHPIYQELVEDDSAMLSVGEDGQVLVTASVDIPQKFYKYLQAEQNKVKYAGQ